MTTIDQPADVRSYPKLPTSKSRNADIRAALKAAFPGAKFVVRNGRDSWAHVTWTDGPSRNDVSSVIDAVPCPIGSRWGAYKTRELTARACAVGFLRAHEAGKFYYSEKHRETGEQIAAGDVRPSNQVLGHWACLEDSVDATAITPAEYAKATLLVKLAGIEDPDALVDEKDDGVRVFGSPRAREIARTLFHHHQTLDAVIAPA